MNNTQDWIDLTKRIATKGLQTGAEVLTEVSKELNKIAGELDTVAKNTVDKNTVAKETSENETASADETAPTPPANEQSANEQA